MDIIKKTGHWIAFIIGGYFATWFALLIFSAPPILVGLWAFNWNIFLFIIVVGILLTIYYYLLIIGLGFYYFFINDKKPDYWISSIFLALVAIYYFYAFINQFSKAFDQDIDIFMNLKGFIFFVAILPAYWKMFYMSVIGPFFFTKNEQ
jgi:hypothetical protein